eukprot:7194589-Pyramimonas_sp.AAC.1
MGNIQQLMSICFNPWHRLHTSSQHATTWINSAGHETSNFPNSRGFMNEDAEVEEVEGIIHIDCHAHQPMGMDIIKQSLQVPVRAHGAEAHHSSNLVAKLAK